MHILVHFYAFSAKNEGTPDFLTNLLLCKPPHEQLHFEQLSQKGYFDLTPS